MPVPKVIGFDTEYGLVATHPSDPALNLFRPESEIIRAFARDARRRGIAVAGCFHEDGISDLGNLRLQNGGRYYNDLGQAEISSAECYDILELTAHDRAGDLLIMQGVAALQAQFPDLVVKAHRMVHDFHGTSWGRHENYLIAREAWADVLDLFPGYLVSRQVFAGAGKVGLDTWLSSLLGSDRQGPSNPDRSGVGFQLSMRSDFITTRVGEQTTHNRPLMNTRDEPHAPPEYRRLHVIVGDPARAELATFLTAGVTAVVLGMIEDRYLDDIADLLRLADPVDALHRVSHDLTLRRPIALANGGTVTALEIQRALFEHAKAYQQTRGLSFTGPHSELLMERWEQVLDALERDPMELATQLDWPAKLRVFEHFRQREGIDWSHPRMEALDLQYCLLDPATSLFDRLKLERLVDPAEIVAATTEPPETTRAYFRGKAIQLGLVRVAQWDELLLHTKAGRQRLRMREPLMGTKLQTGHLFADPDHPPSPVELAEVIGEPLEDLPNLEPRQWGRSADGPERVL